MNRYGLAAIATAALLLAACGGKDTMASKSAAAFREAQAKGTPVAGGHEHGGHEAERTADHSTMAGMDHSTMDHSTMTGMDHSKMDHSTMTGMDHSKMDHSTMTGMDHSKMDHSTMTGMDHSKMDHSTTTAMDHSKMDHSNMPGMDHGGASAPVAVVTGAPRSSADIKRIEPNTTLQPDDYDTPAPTAVAEAEKAAGGGGHAGHDESQPGKEVLYVCPMHPEVTSHEPGTCPKCGMTLVKKEQ